MKVLTFTSLFPNTMRRHLGVFVYQRVAHFARLPETDVHVVAPVPYCPAWLKVPRWKVYSQVPREERIGDLWVSHPRYPLLPGILMPLHGLLMFLGCVQRVRLMHRRIRFDCIDAHYVYPDGFAAVLLGKTLGLPTFVSARGTDINVFPAFYLIRPMIRWTLRHATGLIAVSPALKERMTTLGIPSEKIQVISNGIDTERFHPMDRSQAKKRLGLQKEGPMILCVASLTLGKRHQLLIQAIAEIGKRIPDLKAYIVGEGVLRSELDALIRKLGLGDRVFLAGEKPNEDLYLWFNAADVSCLLSASEGWPNVVMESIACGTPVVASRVGGIPEILVSPQLGILVDGDPQAVAAGITAALTCRWDRQAMIRHSQSRTWEAVAAEVDALFRSRIENWDNPVGHGKAREVSTPI